MKNKFFFTRRAVVLILGTAALLSVLVMSGCGGNDFHGYPADEVGTAGTRVTTVVTGS